jgi:hypothetical protein
MSLNYLFFLSFKNKTKQNQFKVMNFIIQKAVETLLIDKSQASALAEIICATSNPDHAVSLLFGVYKEPLIHGRKFGKNKETYEFYSYDPWSNNLVYKYQRFKTTGIYISKEINPEIVNHENYKDYEKSWSSKETQHITIKFPERETGTSNMSLEKWNDLQNDYTMEEVYIQDILENPEEYGLI